jgi:AcrR family transcriptional regulator
MLEKPCYNRYVNTVNFEVGMEDIQFTDNVRSRLVLAGLAELEKHGAVDFSLRRVAKEAGVSCAAPYRHFKDKDELIASVIDYVLEGWTLLAGQLAEVFAEDKRALLVELTVAGLRFWIANGDFRTVIMASAMLEAGHRGALSGFDAPILGAISSYLGTDASDAYRRLSFKLLSMLYGAIILVDGGLESADRAAEDLRAAVLSEL